MNPYIITTRPKCPNCRVGDGEGECLCADAVSHHAVATLEKASDSVKAAIDAAFPPESIELMPAGELADPESPTGRFWNLIDDADCLRDTKAGGTIGPLPDGTMIEVECVSPLMLASRTPGFSPEALLACAKARDFQPLIDAFNTAHG